jgi:hypothetical protein
VLGSIGALVGPASIGAGPHVPTSTKGTFGSDGVSHGAPPSQPIPHTPAAPISSPAPTASPTSGLPPGAAPASSNVAAGGVTGAIGHGTGVSQGALSVGHPSPGEGFLSQPNAEVVNLTSVAEVVGVTALGASGIGAAGMASGQGAPHAPTTTQAQAQGTSSGHGPPGGRMDPIMLFLHFQSISSSGLLSLRYPPIYRAFTTNFAWANFILPIHSFKVAAQKMRKCDLNEDPAGRNSVLSETAVPPVSSGVTVGETTGIDAYALRIGISPQDIFGIAYLVFLCACAVLLGLFLLVGLVVQISVFTAKTADKKQAWLARREKWAGMSSNNSLRIVCTYTLFFFF